MDLNKYQTAEDQLNAFFENINSNLDSNTYPEAVRNRDNVKISVHIVQTLITVL